MNAFAEACTVEEDSKRILLPFIKRRAHDGQMVVSSKGPLARAVQETMGDGFYNTSSEGFFSFELKAEKTNAHGNFFLETWSNRNLENRENHAKFGSNPGWLVKLTSDLLLYHFIEEDNLYVINLFALQQWAFRDGNIYRYPERGQAKYSQRNDTWGRCVPIGDIGKQVGFRLFNPRMEIWGGD